MYYKSFDLQVTAIILYTRKDNLISDISMIALAELP